MVLALKLPPDGKFNFLVSIHGYSKGRVGTLKLGFINYWLCTGFSTPN